MLNPATQAGRRGAYRTSCHTPIKRRRLQLGLTQVEAARKCCMSLRTFQRVEAADVVPVYVKRQAERLLGMTW